MIGAMQPMRNYYRRLQGFSRNTRLYLLFSFFGGLNFSLYFLFFNLYILSLGYEPDFLGLLVALPAIVGTVVAIPAGLLGDRIGYKRALLLLRAGRIDPLWRSRRPGELARLGHQRTVHGRKQQRGGANAPL
jgi:nitrate/nitrite transporter NarK